jgi:hypothetical protein
MEPGPIDLQDTRITAFKKGLKLYKHEWGPGSQRLD